MHICEVCYHIHVCNMYIYKYVHMYAYVYVYVSIYVCVYIYIFIYMPLELTMFPTRPKANKNFSTIHKKPPFK